jgi:glycopeptide antibiotics resistance protein
MRFFIPLGFKNKKIDKKYWLKKMSKSSLVGLSVLSLQFIAADRAAGVVDFFVNIFGESIQNIGFKIGKQLHHQINQKILRRNNNFYTFTTYTDQK